MMQLLFANARCFALLSMTT